MSNPPRLDGEAPDDPGVGTMWLVVAAALAVWFLVGSTYASVKLAQAPHGTPTSQITFSPHDMVVLSVVAPLAVIATIAAATRLRAPGGLRRLGLSARSLPRGLLLGLLLAAATVPLV